MRTQFDVDIPVTLQVQVDIDLNQERIQPDPIQALRNPNERPMLIDEIRFEIDPSGFWPAQIPVVEFDVGSIPLCLAPVPIFMFGRRDPLAPDAFIWRPQVPIYVPRGWVLTPRFGNRPLTDEADPLSIVVTYIGRSLFDAPLPKTLILPWVAPYYPEPFSGTNTQEQLSTPSDLANTTTEDVHVDYLLSNAYLNGSAGFFARILGYQQTRVRLFDPHKLPLVRDPIPMLSVFSQIDGAWDINYTLAPREAFALELTTYFAPSTDDYDRLLFSMVGHREVSLR